MPLVISGYLGKNSWKVKLTIHNLEVSLCDLLSRRVNSLWGHISMMGVSRMQLCTGRSQRPEATVLYQSQFYPATGSATEPGARLAVKRPAALLSQLPTIGCRSVHGYTYLFMGLLCACTQTPTLAQKTRLPTDSFPHLQVQMIALCSKRIKLKDAHCLKGKYKPWRSITVPH